VRFQQMHEERGVKENPSKLWRDLCYTGKTKYADTCEKHNFVKPLYAGFEVITTVPTNSVIFWAVTLCSPIAKSSFLRPFISSLWSLLLSSLISSPLLSYIFLIFSILS
jgi:hypothetical protein